MPLRILPIWALIFGQVLMTGCSSRGLLELQVDSAINSIDVIDVESGAILEDQTILVGGDRILAVIPANAYSHPRGARTIDGRGLYAIPGLWDMHVHMVNDLAGPVPWDFHRPGPDEGEQREIYMPLYLAFGVTGMRELSGGVASIELREKIQAGEILGPHMVVGSPLLDGPNPAFPGAAHIPVDGPATAEEVVSSLHAQGFDFLKTYNFLSAESYRAVHRRAGQLGMEVSGEIPIGVSLWEAAELGHRTVEHLTGVEFACSRREEALRAGYVARIEALSADTPSEDRIDIWNRSEWEPYASLDPEKCTRLYAHLAEHGTWVVPTLIIQRMISHLDEPQIANNRHFRYLSRWDRDLNALADEFDPRRRLRQLHDYRVSAINDLHVSGVGILAGSDTPGGFTLHEELELFVEGGLTPLAALQTATINPARYLQRTDEFGSILPGRVADLVLLSANPLQDIRNTQSIEAVFFQGHLLERKQLDLMLDQVEEDARNWPE